MPVTPTARRAGEYGRTLTYSPAATAEGLLPCQWCGTPTALPQSSGVRLCGTCRPERRRGRPPRLPLGPGYGCCTPHPAAAERVAQLAAMYAAALEYPSEAAARRAGLPTRVEELPWPDRPVPVLLLAVSDDEHEGDDACWS